MVTARPQTPHAPRRSVQGRAVVGVTMVVIGFVLCLAYRITAPDEPHSYAAGAVAPYDVALTQARLYHLAIHRGVDAEQDAGVAPNALSCTYSEQSGIVRPLAVTAESLQSKATNVIATFQAPLTGRVHVACTGLTAVFVDDADDASTDRSGLYLLLGVIGLGLGIPLALSALRSSTSVAPTTSGGSREHDEIERPVDGPLLRTRDDEVGRAHRGDVGGE